VVRVTGNFRKESPLHPKAEAALLAVFDAGWADPRKLSSSSSKAHHMRQEALESIAHQLSLRSDEIEILGEPLLGHFLSIAGLATSSKTTIFYSATSRSEVIATARAFESEELPVDIQGNISSSPVSEKGILALQIANGETGKITPADEIAELFPECLIACDSTTTPDASLLPSRWDSALFDSGSWSGPSGIGILAIRNSKQWKNPLPHIGISRVPQSYSLPLLLSSVVALEAWKSEIGEDVRLRELSKELRSRIAASVTDCDIAGELDTSLSNISSFSFLYCHGEELLRELSIRGFDLDSGSACTSDDLAPSHVLAAMGILTHGNIRVTIHRGTTREEIHELGSAIIESVAQMRANN
jgi:cysteine desulfurase